MKSFAKFPLYLGLGVLVFSVIISAVKVGNEQALNIQRTKASAGGAGLSLQFVPPDKVSVLLTAPKDVAGADITIKYNTRDIKIPPSSLIAGPSFVTTGAVADPDKGTFTFSAVAKKSSVSNGIVATFDIMPLSENKNVSTNLDFESNQAATTVIDKVSGQNVLSTAQGRKFSIITK